MLLVIEMSLTPASDVQHQGMFMIVSYIAAHDTLLQPRSANTRFSIRNEAAVMKHRLLSTSLRLKGVLVDSKSNEETVGFASRGV